MKSFADDLFNLYVIIDAKANDNVDDNENWKMQNVKLIKKTKKNCGKNSARQTLSHLSETETRFLRNSKQV